MIRACANHHDHPQHWWIIYHSVYMPSPPPDAPLVDASQPAELSSDDFERLAELSVVNTTPSGVAMGRVVERQEAKPLADDTDDLLIE